MRKVYLVVLDIRSTHNVGSILRTADGLGVEEVYLCGYTPYPKTGNDERPPYLAEQINKRISKTALGAEKSQRWSYVPDHNLLINRLRSKNIKIISLEQNKKSIDITKFDIDGDIALIAGNETEGLKKSVLVESDYILEIPMAGVKESFNVSVAVAISLFYLKFMI